MTDNVSPLRINSSEPTAPLEGTEAWLDWRSSDGLESEAPSFSDEWRTLLEVRQIPVCELASVVLPDEPGVYLWRRRAVPVYVGMAKNLQSRIWKRHLGNGLSLATSSIRRNVCELLHGIPTTETSNPSRVKVSREQADDIRAWLLECNLSWVTCASQHEADQLERRLRTVFLPPLNRV